MNYEKLDVTDERVRELAQVLANERAMAILKLLREHELSISEISKKLEMPISTVSYHIDKLLRVGLVEVSGRKYGKRLQEVKLYRASSRPILLLPRPAGEKSSALDRLKVITLSVATGLSVIVYLISERYFGAQKSRPPAQSESVKMLSTETTRQTMSSGHLPLLLAVMVFAIVVFVGWFLKKRF